MAEGDITVPGLTLTLNLSGTYKKEVDLSNVIQNIGYTKTLALVNGVGDDQANLVWHDTRTVSAGVPDDLDLVATLNDVFNRSLTFVELVALIIFNRSATLAEKLLIGGDALPLALFGAGPDYLILPAGGLFVWTAPLDGSIVIGAGATDVLQIDVAAGSTDYDILMVGRDA